jgi:transposase
VCCYGRRTLRLSAAHWHLAHALGGEAGARLAELLGLAASGDTLLRRLKQSAATIPAFSAPRCLGVDEWAWRKGRTYRTLLCNLERGTIVDLLSERGAESLAERLKAHPGVEVISRDRSPIYAEGAHLGAPDAIQVAGRRHLFRHLTDALQKILERQHARLRRAAAEAARTMAPTPEPKKRRPRATEQRKQANRARRLARDQEAVDLKAKGWAHCGIARRVGTERRAVRWRLQHGSSPQRTERAPQQRLLAPYLSYLRLRWREGVRRVRRALPGADPRSLGPG